MRTNRINAPPAYPGAKPVKEGRQQPEPRMVRVYHCVDCKQPGGTLRNIGTHKKPVYICTYCLKTRETIARLRILRK
ncbi:MAG: hypothetical protein A2Y92_04025 [Chloroflexi bacterium RBG_13_57_8]|nr:MAG: hypothetical protein A2Y92_04025 [Chloroflexi bacterium RBG_13_57_8]